MRAERQKCPDKQILKSCRSCSGSNGFTLIELIIVMVIIVVASGIVGIMIGKGSEGLKLKTYTKEVSSILRYARNHAVSEKKNYCFVINKEDGVVRLYTEASDKDAESGDDRSGDLITVTKPLPDDLTININEDDSDVQDMEFFPQGNSSGGTIKIENEKGAVFYIYVNRLTGRVEVEKEE